jgi:hypothetical protein
VNTLEQGGMRLPTAPTLPRGFVGEAEPTAGDSPVPLAIGTLDDLSAPHLLARATVAGRYIIEDCLGVGGMGKVFRARHARLGRPFAMKLLRTAYADDASRKDRFLEEARIASALVHPNIVQVVDFGEDPVLGAFMVMEFIDGEPLSRRLAQGLLPVPQVCELALQIGQALAYMHEQDVVHGDLKPNNIIVARDTDGGLVAKLLDFGLAQPGSSSGGGREVEGTPEYMAPELLRGEAPRASMDIYALGVMLHEMLAGGPPFVGTISQIVAAQLLELPPSLPAERASGLLAALVMRALEKEPGERFPTVHELLAALRALTGAEPVARHAPSVERRLIADRMGFQRAPVPMAWLNIDGTIVRANRALAKLVTGDEEADLDGLNALFTKLLQLYPQLAVDMRRTHLSGVETRRVLRAGLVAWMNPGDDAAGDVQLTLCRPLPLE